MKNLFFFLVCLTACGKTPAPIDPLLIGGLPADPKDWPASVYAASGNSRCSATVVGEKVLLIASHCVSNGGKSTFSIGANQYSSTCTHHPEYRNNSTADWAMCAVDRKVEGIKYENLNTDAGRVKLGIDLTLTGYGCTKPNGGGGNDGIYRFGVAPIVDLPNGTDYDITTRGKAALCYGDSGGPAFVVQGTQRWVVGVNSRGNISTTSYLPAVHVQAAQDWFKSWASAKGVKICGIHQDAVDCRDEVKPLPVDFTVDGKAGSCTGKVKSGYEALLPDIARRIKDVLDTN